MASARTPREVATLFAMALDSDDFDSAEALLAPDCVYEFRGTRLCGAATVMKPYRDNGARARTLFDEVRYESRVLSADERGAVLEFVDHLRKGSATCVHRCHQLLSVGSDGGILRVEHVDLPGERESLLAFCTLHGIAL